MLDIAQLERLADAVSVEANADVLVYSGPLMFGNDDRVIDLCRRRNCRPNVVLMLSTYGGDARVAYRIARRLQTRYERFTVFVYGYCKSAGTLLALGAHELALSDSAELGPLDVQVRKTDEVGESSSGLAPLQALDTLKGQAFDLFQDHFTRLRGELEMSTKLAADVASKMTVGLLGHVYGQIDPVRVGELSREMRVALEYGERLIGGDPKKGWALTRLVSRYPTHGFAIDRREAEGLFDGVRVPTSAEEALAEYILNVARYPADTSIIEFVGLAPDTAVPPQEATHEQDPGSHGQGSDARKFSADGCHHERSQPRDTRQPRRTDPAATRAPASDPGDVPAL